MMRVGEFDDRETLWKGEGRRSGGKGVLELVVAKNLVVERELGGK